MTEETSTAEDSYEGYVGPERQRLPKDRQGITHKVAIMDEEMGAQEGYIVLNRYENGAIGEIFIQGFAKEGSTVDGFIQWGAVEFSLALQYGAEIEMMCRKLAHMKFSPRGPTDNPHIPYAHSIPAYLAELIAFHFGDFALRGQLSQIREALRA